MGITSRPAVLFVVFGITTLVSCGSIDFQGYRLTEPSQVIELPKSMREISGLAWWHKDHIAMVQDEKGEIFLFDISRDEFRDKTDFGKDGDYEGVATNGEDLFAVRSNGRITRMNGISGKDTDQWNTPLTTDNDVEGACWDPKRDRLLLACKADPGSGLNKKLQRAVYAFDPVTGTMDADPVLVIHLDSIASHLSVRDQKSDHIKFAPSAIAIEPATQNYWILSGHDRMIVVLDSSGAVIDTTYLLPTLFPQPEGLDFDPTGKLFISSEGHNGAGRLLVYKPYPG